MDACMSIKKKKKKKVDGCMHVHEKEVDGLKKKKTQTTKATDAASP